MLGPTICDAPFVSSSYVLSTFTEAAYVNFILLRSSSAKGLRDSGEGEPEEGEEEEGGGGEEEEEEGGCGGGSDDDS